MRIFSLLISLFFCFLYFCCDPRLSRLSLQQSIALNHAYSSAWRLPLLFISIKFIRQLIPVAHVEGGVTEGSPGISQSVLRASSCSEPHSRERLAFYNKVHPSLVQQVIKCSFAGMMLGVSAERRERALLYIRS